MSDMHQGECKNEECSLCARRRGLADGRKQGVAEERARVSDLLTAIMEQVDRGQRNGDVCLERAIDDIEELVFLYRGEHVPKAGE